MGIDDQKSAPMPLRWRDSLPEDKGVLRYPRPVTDPQRKGLLEFWERIGVLHRHEDTLLNNRLQIFLITTSLLLAAFSQFRETRYVVVQFLIAIGGFLLSCVMRHILGRTSRAIEWYIQTLCDLDLVIFPENQQPYLTRRREMASHRRGAPVTKYLAFRLPEGVAVLWVGLFTWSLYGLAASVIGSRVCLIIRWIFL
jgi:hypothetical protein